MGLIAPMGARGLDLFGGTKLSSRRNNKTGQNGRGVLKSSHIELNKSIAFSDKIPGMKWS